MKRFTVSFLELGNGSNERRAWVACDENTEAKHREALSFLGLKSREEEIQDQPLFDVTVMNDHKDIRICQGLRTKNEISSILSLTIGSLGFDATQEKALEAFYASTNRNFTFSDAVSGFVSVSRP